MVPVNPGLFLKITGTGIIITKKQGCGVGVWSRWSRMFSAGVGVGFSKLLESESGVGVGTFVAITDSNVY